MTYLPLQLIVTIFVILVVYRLIKKFRDRLLKFTEFLGWLAIWLIVLAAFWLPQTTSYLAKLFGIGRGVDLAVYLAVLMIFYLIFRLYLKIDKQQQDLTKIIRHLSLKESDKNPTDEQQKL